MTNGGKKKAVCKTARRAHSQKDNVTKVDTTDFGGDKDSFYYKFYVTWLSIGVRFIIPVLLLIIFNSLLIRQVSKNLELKLKWVFLVDSLPYYLTLLNFLLFWLQVRKTRMALSGLTGFATQKTDIRLAIMTIVVVAIFIIGHVIRSIVWILVYFKVCI